MGQITYTVTLATSGRHTVTVSGDDPAGVSAAVRAWADNTLRLLAASRQPVAARPASGEDGVNQEQPPVCGVHAIPMVRQQGRHGQFWSCHEWNEDGSFCTYRPTQAAA
jgi:hypothetical protein